MLKFTLFPSVFFAYLALILVLLTMASILIAPAQPPATARNIVQSAKPTNKAIEQQPLQLYHDPLASSRRAPADWLATQPLAAAQINELAKRPTALWFGDWNADVQTEVAERLQQLTEGEVAVIVAYNIPARDCGGYSRGGAVSDELYIAWVDALARGIADHQAMVILEPDALAGLDCLPEELQTRRIELLRTAVTTLANRPNISTYIDAGHSRWQPAEVMAQRLRQAGVDRAQGFSLNVSNFNTTQEETVYGQQLSNLSGGAHFVIDTSRNGNGPAPNNEWCNPAGRSVGEQPTLETGHPLVDGFLWVKIPGESDGTCNGGPEAGEWWPDYALGLVKNAS
jgi:endoglucanase